MQHYICTTCGTQFAPTDLPPTRCPICQDERQYIPLDGQRWTTLDALRRDHTTVIGEENGELTGIGMEPAFAIGQRALLIPTPQGNVLWDCISLLDDAAIKTVRGMGGLSAIAISHPHYYTSMVEWSRAFDAPIYLHAADRQWVMRPDRAVRHWDGDTQELPGGLTLIRAGGHFDGGTVLHWPAGAEGRGALLSGDIVQVIPDRQFVSFMYSYPNLIPLGAEEVRRIVDALRPFPFDRLYGAWWGRVVPANASEIVLRSADRYCAALQGRHGDDRAPEPG